MSLSPEDVTAYQRAQSALTGLRTQAMADPVVFQAAVLRDEQGRPFRPAPLHERWQDLITEHDRLVLWAPIEHGKTSSISVGRVLYELARDPNIRIAVISNTGGANGLATKILRTVASYIERSPELRAVAPHLVPGQPWAATNITVQRPYIMKDPSVQACGVHGDILGSRVDLLILDDIIDFENVYTKAQRQQLLAWYDSTLTGRLTAKARVICVGTPWDPDDLYHQLAKRPGWRSAIFPAQNPVTGLPAWPEAWSLERLQKKREDMHPLEAARQLDCRARDDSQARFKREYIDRCLARGAGRSMKWGLQRVPPGHRVFTGVDLAVQEKDKADRTAIFDVAVTPDGSREVLCIESGHWGGPQILEKIADHNKRFMPQAVVVENNAAQEYIAQFLRAQTAIPVLSYTTGRSKASPEFGVERLAGEMANGKWVIPNEGGAMHPEVSAWVDEMLFYHPASHTGDRLMASWFCVEGERLLAAATPPRAGTTSIDLLRR